MKEPDAMRECREGYIKDRTAERLEGALRDMLPETPVMVNGEGFKRAKEWVSVPDYFLVSVNEFLSDWRKGDFSLNTLAALDAQAIEAARERWATEIKRDQR